MHTLLIFMTALFVSLVLVPILRRWALVSGTLDTPNERKIHEQATPRFGGVAIYLSFLFTILVFVEFSREVRGILAGGLVVFVVGLLDDLYGLSPKKKFAGEISGVVVTMMVGHLYIFNLGNLFGFGEIVLPFWLAIPFTIFAVVGVTNAINLIDGLDGLSGGVSVIALVSFMLLAFHDGLSDVMFLCAALTGAVIGFLKYNTYPARIFMGDAGSLNVGFVLGSLAVFLSQAPRSTVSPMVPVVVLGLPVIDAIWVMVRRLMKSKGPFTSDMTHVHHKFLDLGFQHRFVVIIIYGISLFWALVAIVARSWPEYMLLLTYIVVSMIFYGVLRYLINHREQFPFMARDSAGGLRDTDIYRRLSAIIDSTSPLLLGLVVVYILIAIVADFSEVVEYVWITLTFMVSVAAYCRLRYVRKHRVSPYFVKVIFYLMGLLVAFLVDRASGVGLLIAKTEIVVFSLITILVVLRSLFRHENDIVIGISESVVLITGIFALVAFSQVPELKHLASVPIRGGILFLAMNTVIFSDRSMFGSSALLESSQTPF